MLISELGAPLVDVVSLRNERSKIFDAESASVSRCNDPADLA